ncbi:MAG TPA: MFS transporter, partial [Pseudobdellovibrionaceae bacterium]|nr:MFS transporter [Pseudobdellovibrionaceae bacterium]
MKNLFQSYSKQQWSWALYDWANSTYSTTVMAGFFPVFFKEYWSFGFDPSISTARLGGSVSIASFIVAFLTPFLGAVADRRPWKKKLLFSFMLLGAISCGVMASVEQGAWQMA